MQISDITSIISVFIALIGVIFVIRQLTLTRLSIDADHLRRKKESTFNGYNKIREDYRRLNREVLDKLELKIGDELSLQQLSIIRDNPEIKVKIQTVLSYVQRIAVGVENDIYDINIMFDLSGTVFIQTFERYYPYVLEARSKSITYYQEAEHLINKLRELREERIKQISL